MPLSNAERQRRYVDRLKQGVTPEMVREAARIYYENDLADDDLTWDAYLQACKAKPELWRLNLPDRTAADYTEFGSNGEMMRTVARVIQAIEEPPSE